MKVYYLWKVIMQDEFETVKYVLTSIDSHDAVRDVMREHTSRNYHIIGRIANGEGDGVFTSNEL